MIGITNSHSIFNSIAAEQTNLPDLQAIISRWHPDRIRRIDRYIQLCLAGGLSCVGERTLPENSGLYLSTHYGVVSTSAKVINTIELEGYLPKPLHFVNTLGNSAGFYLTQLLRITGNTLLVSQEEFSFEAALLHACVDLNSGLTTTALVGGVDEVALPFAKQLERLKLPTNTRALHEGSHWLLLEKTNATTQMLTMPEYLAEASALKRWLQQHQDVPLQLCFSPTAEEQALLTAHQWREFLHEAPIQGSYSGAALTSLTINGERGIHLNRNSIGQYCAVVVGQNKQ